MFTLSICFAALAFAGSAGQTPSAYVLGPGDLLMIRALYLDEIGQQPFRVDMRGSINVPLAGRVNAGGLTVEQLEAELAARLKRYLLDPAVHSGVTEFRAQPVSVLGSVNTPGVLQIHGAKTLFEVLSQAGGLRSDAGAGIKITRRKELGPIPLSSAAPNATGEFSVAEIGVRSIMEARNPEENILVRAGDVISVPRAEIVYVIGAVRRSGGFALHEKETISTLQALSLAEGLDREAAPQSARILRPAAGGEGRIAIPIDLKKILSAKSGDVPLLANDILFVPTISARSVAIRTLEAAVQVGTGAAIYRR